MSLIEITNWKIEEIFKYQLKLISRGYGNFDITPVVNGRVKYLMVFEKLEGRNARI